MLTFNGNASSPRRYAYVLNPTAIDGLAAVTFCCRLFVTAFAGAIIAAFSRADSANPSADLLWLGGSDLGASTFQPRVRIITTTAQYTAETGTLNYNQWYHILGRWTGSALTLWVDGTQTASTAGSGSLKSSTYALVVGGNNDQTEPTITPDCWTGNIEDVRIYNRALSDAEISCIAVGGDNIVSGLVAGYSLSEGVDGSAPTTIKDRSISGLNLTVSGAPTYGQGRIIAPRSTGIPGLQGTGLF